MWVRYLPSSSQDNREFIMHDDCKLTPYIRYILLYALMQYSLLIFTFTNKIIPSIHVTPNLFLHDT